MFEELLENKIQYVRTVKIKEESVRIDDINNNIILKERFLFSLNVVKKIFKKENSNKEIRILNNNILFKKDSLLIEKELSEELIKREIRSNYLTEVNLICEKLNISSYEIIKSLSVINEKNAINIHEIINEEAEKSQFLKDKIENIYLNKGSKINIIEKDEIIKIFENEKNDKNNGLTISESVNIKKASVIRENIHIAMEYPLMSVQYEKIEDLENLKQYFPNFKEVIDDIIGYVSLSLIGESSYFYMKPILLSGDPGLGKTAFAKSVAKILNLGFKKIPLTTVTAAWVITGLDFSWNGGKPGKIFNILSQTGMANPIIFLDEIDKAKNSDSGGNPLDTLHDLLEKETSTEVLDEALNVYMNASKINWIATANDLNKIPESILSRFQIFNIKDVKNENEKYFVIRNVFSNMLNELPNGDCFLNELSEDICFILKDKNIRTISNEISRAIGKAAKRSLGNEDKIAIKKEDFNLNY